MISVTVAAQGKQKRLFGGRLKAYDCKRLSLFELERSADVETKNKKWKIVVFFTKLIEAVLLLFCFNSPKLDNVGQNLKNRKNDYEKKSISVVDSLVDDVLITVFKHMNLKSLLDCKMVCRKWNKLICKNAADLARYKTDQLRILFDQGEIMMYPVDEKKSPLRRPLPSLQVLRKFLLHRTAQSLFIRGLIPVESGSVLRLLLTLDLQPQQVYFIWSKLSLESVHLLEKLLKKNSATITDFGLEEFAPSHLITDRTILPIIRNLTSLRLWNSGEFTNYGVTDETIQRIGNTILDGSNIETIDMGSCVIMTDSVVSLIKKWKETANNDLTVMLSNCRPVSRTKLIAELEKCGIQLKENRHFHSRSHMLTLIC